ncbi:MAG TPA: PfkB family carbohydrate kinase [Actinomycetota bacterium]|nr:PfkB family carbohydrate kinase [Actinomycetota bacterium]
MAEFDLLVLGDAKPDLILTGADEIVFGVGERVIDEARLTLGGSGAICACGAAALGLRVAFAGVIGDDEYGAFVAGALAARGVDTTGIRIDPQVPTGVSVVLKRGDQEAVLTSRGTVGTFSADDVDPAALASARHVHVASYFLQEALRPSLGRLFASAHAAGGSTSVDPNRDYSGDWDGGLFDLLPSSDVLFANSSEIREITGVDDVDVAAEALAERGTVVAVKFLQGGGLAVWGDEMVRSEAIPTTVVDTTGAGASFAAGFIAGRLEGLSLDRCLALAVSCASLSTRAVGGTASQPTMEEALGALEATA